MNGLQFDNALTALAATEARPSVYADRLQRFAFGQMLADNRYWRPGLAVDEHERAGFRSVVDECHMAALVEDTLHTVEIEAFSKTFEAQRLADLESQHELVPADAITAADVAVLQTVPEAA